MLIKALIFAAVLLASPTLAAETEDRYALELSVVRDGVEVIAGRTLIVEDKQAEMSLTDGDLRYELNADLNRVRGDHSDLILSLNANISHGDDQHQLPSLTIRRGGTARMVVGRENEDGLMIDGMTLTLTPIAPASH